MNDERDAIGSSLVRTRSAIPFYRKTGAALREVGPEGIQFIETNYGRSQLDYAGAGSLRSPGRTANLCTSQL
ncbi:hypothetical protein [Paenibacillus guangzhouensis]|uniref:hypothetical protein n=1 Tax=Paenibacillus guangzhouensis TaxID=1473112 RepID=UPI001266B80B|nr:hypothetical protein [Paenibacillus guangzhouensis]